MERTTDRMAYCILAHNQPKQLAILLELLDDERNDIYLMIDKKTDISEYTRLTTQKSKLTFITKRISVWWGHHSQIEAELILLKAVLATGNPYNHIHLLSGADLPLKSQDEIHDFFNEHLSEEFIDISNTIEDEQDIIDKTEYSFYWGKYLRREGWIYKNIHLRLFDYSRRFLRYFRIKRKYPFKIRKGSQWFSITRGFAKWLVDNQKHILKTFKFTWCPDEFMLQSYIFESPFYENISKLGNLRLIDWERGYPYVWRKENFEEIISSGKLFGRKFSLQDDSEIIDLMRTHLKQMTLPDNLKK